MVRLIVVVVVYIAKLKILSVRLYISINTVLKAKGQDFIASYYRTAYTISNYIKKVNKCLAVSYCIKPSINNTKSFIENKEKLIRVTSSSSRVLHNTAITLGEPSQVEISR
ncbi:hypothetical protein CEK25_010640 [Fusarium fujikuroi]|nr:hypothetical protein CEK25_010640 [Fusarium fujikuroi]